MKHNTNKIILLFNFICKQEYRTVYFDSEIVSDSHTVKITNGYCSILNFFKIDEAIFVLVQMYDILDKQLIKPMPGELNKYNLLKRRISDFYVFAKLSSQIKLIPIQDIVTRCLVIESGENLVLTPCVDLNEHD